MRRLRRETFPEKAYRYRGVILVVSVPLVLISFILVLMPRTSVESGLSKMGDPFDRFSEVKPGSKRYAVIFDAGSSGSRVHVFCFDEKLNLVPIGDGLELFKQKKPGLSSYAMNPKEGANSLRGLLNDALQVVPSNIQSSTPVQLGATAGLRALPGSQSQELLQEVKALLEESKFRFIPSWVTILDGKQEGAYQWITVNYLLGFLGKSYKNTVGIVDLGGGSVQMAYAISDGAAQKAPKPEEGEDSYVQKLKLLGKSYNLYVHSYLHYGLLAARAEVLKVADESGSSCIMNGFEGSYKYGGESYQAKAPSEGADFHKCKELVSLALNVNKACKHMKCTFGGVWSGGGGDGQKKLIVASFFFDRALEVGIIQDPNALEAKVRPSNFKEIAESICRMKLEEVETKATNVEKENRPYICLDLVYEYTLLVEGFGIDPEQEITLVKRIRYKGSEVEAAWPLGTAIQVMSENL